MTKSRDVSATTKNTNGGSGESSRGIEGWRRMGHLRRELIGRWKEEAVDRHDERLLRAKKSEINLFNILEGAEEQRKCERRIAGALKRQVRNV